MIILGLTGSIGMGKSTASRILSRMGCAVHDADITARQALHDPAVVEAVALSFPACWDKKNRVIDRKILADIVFHDVAAKKTLENILHPVVRQGQQDFLVAQARIRPRRGARRMVVLDIPLLFETGADARVDYTAVVSAPYAIQRRRVLARQNMTAERFAAINKLQMANEDKCAMADFVIPTGLGLACTYRAIRIMVHDIVKTGESIEDVNHLSQTEK